MNIQTIWSPTWGPCACAFLEVTQVQTLLTNLTRQAKNRRPTRYRVLLRFVTVIVAYRRWVHSLATVRLPVSDHYTKVTIRPVFSGTVRLLRCLSRKIFDIKRDAVVPLFILRPAFRILKEKMLLISDQADVMLGTICFYTIVQFTTHSKFTKLHTEFQNNLSG